MATIEAMLGAPTLLSIHRRSSVVTHSPKRSLRPSLVINPALWVTLPRPFGRQIRRITCQISKSSGKGDPWQQTVSQPDTFTKYSGYIAEAAIEEADQLDEYNADKIAAVFNRRPFLLARRLIQIAGTLGWWVAVRYGDTFFGKKDQNFKVCSRVCEDQRRCNCWIQITKLWDVKDQTQYQIYVLEFLISHPSPVFHTCLKFFCS